MDSSAECSNFSASAVSIWRDPMQKSQTQQSLLSKKTKQIPSGEARYLPTVLRRQHQIWKSVIVPLLPNAWLIQIRSKGLTLQEELHKCHLSDGKNLGGKGSWWCLFRCLCHFSRGWHMQFQKCTPCDVTRGTGKAPGRVTTPVAKTSLLPPCASSFSAPTKLGQS